MDKLKVFMGHLKKHQFWLLTGVILITGLVGWYLATADLYAGTEARKKEVQGSFSAIKGIDPENPNTKWVNDFDRYTSKAQKDVEATWSDLYKDQRDSVLKWPKELGKNFLDMIHSIGPNADIPKEYRDVYFTYIKEVFPSLVAIIDAENMMGDSARAAAAMRRQGGEGGGFGGGIGGRGRGGEGEGRGFMPRSPTTPKKPGTIVAPLHDYLVEWDAQSQSQLGQMFEWQTTPTAHQVRIAQENLWICEAILRVIAKVNANATGHHNAKIRRIQELQFGKDAAQRFEVGTYSGKVMRIDVDPSKLVSGETRPGGGMMLGGGMRPGGGEAGMRPGAALLDEQSDSNLEKGRYVDATGKVLETTTDPEFKRMPIYLRLVMDQREVNRLLSECANSPLPIVVHQLRINADAGGSLRASQKSAGARTAPGAAYPANYRTRARADETPNPFDVFVELNGIINIFNPPPAPKAKADPSLPADAKAPTETPAEAAPDAPAEPAPTDAPSPDAKEQ